jgi:hypothetical protein
MEDFEFGNLTGVENFNFEDLDGVEDPLNEFGELGEFDNLDVAAMDIGQSSEAWVRFLDGFASADVYRKRVDHFAQFCAMSPASENLTSMVIVYFSAMHAKKLDDDDESCAYLV